MPARLRCWDKQHAVTGCMSMAADGYLVVVCSHYKEDNSKNSEILWGLKWIFRSSSCHGNSCEWSYEAPPGVIYEVDRLNYDIGRMMQYRAMIMT